MSRLVHFILFKLCTWIYLFVSLYKLQCRDLLLKSSLWQLERTVRLPQRSWHPIAHMWQVIDILCFLIVRDNWESKKPEFEKTISELFGTAWTIEVNPLVLQAYATGSSAQQEAGQKIAR